MTDAAPGMPPPAPAVIGAGFGRTGTLSLKRALERLGFAPCYHMDVVIKHPSHVAFWRSAARGDSVDWRAFFTGYRAAVDFPASIFYRELLAHWPDARVILTVRDPQGWYDSTRDTIYRLSHLVPRWARPLAPVLGPFFAMAHAAIWEGVFDGRFEDRQHAVATFERWNAEVQRVVPAAQLLVFDVREGWGPLCRFLGVEAPSEPFPHVNDRRAMQRRIALVRGVTRGVLLLLAAAAVGVLLLTR